MVMNDRKSAITSASVGNEVFKKVTLRCVALRFENLSTSSRYFFQLKDFSLDGLAM